MLYYRHDIYNRDYCLYTGKMLMKYIIFYLLKSVQDINNIL